MSVMKHYRRAWVSTVYAQAVTIFHNARKTNEDNVPLTDLARASANTAFAKNAPNIVGDKEVLAREFMAHCRHHFHGEIQIALANPPTAQTEARAS